MVSPFECLRYLVSCAHTSDLLRTSFGSAILDRCEWPQSAIPCKHGYPAVHTFCWNTSNICHATFRRTTWTSCETLTTASPILLSGPSCSQAQRLCHPVRIASLENFFFAPAWRLFSFHLDSSFTAHHTFPSSSYIVLYLRTWHIALLI